jgi:Glycosyl hydrolase-like 10
MNDVMTEIVSRYAVDGIHFDDYFYPYKVKNEAFNDYATFRKYQSGFSNIEDWRRNNVDLLIYELSQTIKRLRPTVQFGISPFSVWRNRNRDPEGSATRAGVTCYDDLYADVRKWLREGWIDYVVPQAYRAIGDNLIDHAVIMKWWSDNAAGKQVYTGHGTYRVGESSSSERSWRNPNEIPRQIQLARRLPNVYGSVHFSSKSLLKNALGISDSLRLNYYRYPSFSTETYTTSPVAATTFSLFEPYEIRTLAADVHGKVEIRWRQSSLNPQQRPFQYIIYRFRNGQVDFQNGQNIIGIMPPNTKEYIFHESKPNSTYQYAVTVSECVFGTVQTVATEKEKPKVDPSVLKLSKTKAPRKHKGWFRSFWRRVFGR